MSAKPFELNLPLRAQTWFNGKSVYTGLFNQRGGFESDLTLVRLALDEFYIITGTAQAMPELLKQLKAGGYKVVQITAKAPIQTLPEYDELIAKDMQGMPTALSDRPLNSVVKTISGQ